MIHRHVVLPRELAVKSMRQTAQAVDYLHSLVWDMEVYLFFLHS